MIKKILLSLLIGGVCLWLAVRNINWNEVSESLKGITYFPLCIAFFGMFLTHYFRARRFQVLLEHVKEVGTKEMFGINAVGFLAIHIFPLRLGEFTRPLLLKKRHQIPLSTGLATLVIERVFDGVVAALALIIGLWAAPIGLGDMPSLAISARGLIILALGIFIPALGFLLLAVVHREKAIRIFEKTSRLLPQRLQARASNFLHNFFVGLECLPNIKSFFQILVESLAVWGVMIVAYWEGLNAFHLDLHWSAPFSILGIAAMGIMLPSAPGFIGTFQLFVVAALGLYGVSKSTGFSYSIVIHALNLIYVLAAGVLFLPMMATPMKSLFNESVRETN